MNKLAQSHFFIITLSLILVSCSSLQKQDINNTDQFFAKESPKNLKPPSYQEPPATPTTEITPSEHHVHKLNVSVHEIEAREFFMGLVIDSDDNMLVHPDVSGKISLDLKNVSLPMVLEAVQKVYGYDYKKTDLGYIIYPISTQTKTFKVDHLDLLREGKSVTYVTSGQTTTSGSTGTTSTIGQQGVIQPVNNQQIGGTNQINAMASRTSGSTVTTTTKADFWQEIESALMALIASDKEATVVINRQAGVIIARAKPIQLHEIENFLAITQSQISRQVILEAKILEVVLNSSHQNGVEWKSIIRQGLEVAPTALSGGIYALAANAGGFVAGDFTAVVTLLESQGKTNVLSSPRISTLNNQQAIIKVGQDQTFVTGISPGISGGTYGGSTQPVPVLSAFFSGIALDVTPQINDAGDITLHIHPSITKVESQNTEYQIDGIGSTSVVPTALNIIRESDSIVKAKNGQIIVLGGLMQDLSNENKSGVFGLSRLPYIGSLFRLDTGDKAKTELVILLKATLIDNDNDWQKIIDVSQKQLEALDRKPRL
jgi:MSHA biogenesis protein MshL